MATASSCCKVRSSCASASAHGRQTKRHLNLGRHPRSLPLALQAQGQSFRRVLDQVCYAEAQQQLRLSAQSITDLALRLGYADETAFSRAFKRWSGHAPQAWRKQHSTDTLQSSDSRR